VQGFFIFRGKKLDIVYEAAAKYVALEQFEYEFTLSQNRRKLIVRLNFEDGDFFHLCGLQYLKDISIPQNRRKTLENILMKKRITEAVLEQSNVYRHPRPDKDIKGRIEELRFLEQYLDTDNIIRVFTLRNQRNMSSFINADYIIESQFRESSDIVYIFLKQRDEKPDYCGVVSFFKKDSAVYGGDILYWMQKKKTSIYTQESIVLQRHPKYKEFIKQ
jgi:hypothetical protein